MHGQSPLYEIDPMQQTALARSTPTLTFPVVTGAPMTTSISFTGVLQPGDERRTCQDISSTLPQLLSLAGLMVCNYVIAQVTMIISLPGRPPANALLIATVA